MNIISIEDKALVSLVDEVVKQVKGKLDEESWKWVKPNVAMKLLGITSRTTLQQLRDEGEIRYSHPRKRIIMYDRHSINDFLERHAKDTF